MSYHPSYTFPDADLVLASKDSYKFQVHSTILKYASSFFRDMLSMKRDLTESAMDPIQMDESQEVLKTFLDVCYPQFSLSISDIPSVDHLRTLAFLFIEKYDVPAGTAALRALFYDVRTASKLSPISLYGLAKELSWEVEATMMQKATLDVDFATKSAQNQLSELKGPDVVTLTQLRKSICNSVDKALTIEKKDASWYGQCRVSSCPGSLADFPTKSIWEAVRFRIYKELGHRPSGSGLLQLFSGDPSFDNLSKIGKCTRCEALIFTPCQVYQQILSNLLIPEDGHGFRVHSHSTP
ncbi:hypothetical protein ACEPAI_4134 [Sanghuangporus weigelae]